MKVVKDLDAWSEVFIVDPLTKPIVARLIKVKWVKPYHISLCSLITGLSSSLLFLFHHNITAGILWFGSIILDGIDGKLARARKQYLFTHAILDQLFDQLAIAFFIIVAVIVMQSHTLYLVSLLAIFYIFEVSYALRMEFASRYSNNRSLKHKQLDIVSKYEEYLNMIKSTSTSSLLKSILELADRIHRFTFRYRTFPYPKTSDVRFLITAYLIYPNTFVLYLCILFAIPDLVISIFLLWKIARNLEVRYHGCHR